LPPAVYPLALHDALPILPADGAAPERHARRARDLHLAARARRAHQPRVALRATARTPSLRGDSSTTVREDLLQELTLYLWSEMADRKSTRLNSSHGSISY